MNAERLLKHYEKIAEAPDAIARLRRYVLDLAVRGKLVPQNPKDEPASELLKQITREKALLKLKHVQDSVGDVEMPFSLPHGWCWTRVGELSSKTGSGSTPRGGKEVYKTAGIPFLRSQNIYNDGLRLDDVAYIDTATHERMSSTRVLAGDLLLNITGGSIGRCCRVPEGIGEANISQHVAIIRIAINGIDPFLHRLVLSPYFQGFVIGEQTGAGRGGLPKNRMDMIPVALPPLAEQRRIVTRVNELMVLCDQLEAARAEREKSRDRLTAASLARLITPHADSFADDARFALGNLPALTARPDQIKQLRQAILNLAVRGKLVPQDPKDERATELLKRIRAWQAQKISQKTIRAPRKPLSSITSDEEPYPQPSGWVFARLGELIYIQSGDGLTAANMKEGSMPVYGGNGINGYHDQSNVDKPTLVIGRVGYYCGSIHVTPARAWVTDNAFITHFSAGEIHLPFLMLLLKGTNLKEDENATAQPVISGSKIYPIVVGLPPLNEQHKIVAKFDGLMSLCDQLEVSLDSADATRTKLLEALLVEALSGESSLQVEAA
jgi:type I restriction enzyme S subunit